jgi:universal stress protein A
MLAVRGHHGRRAQKGLTRFSLGGAPDEAGERDAPEVLAMKTIRTILCPVDFTDVSRRELALAADLAGRFAADIVLQHNLPAGAALGVMWLHEQEQHTQAAAREKQARVQLSALLDGLPEPVRDRARAALTYGSLDHCVQHMAAHIGADLIVIGTHGRSHADHHSETERLITQAACPVLTMHDGAPDEWLPNLAGDERVRTVVPVDFSDHSVRALNYALNLAEHLPLQIVALHVTHRADHVGPWAEEQLAKSVPAAKRAAVTLEVKRLTTGGAAQDIADEELRLGARLLVMGAHTRGFLEALLAGRRAIAKQILHASSCPVWFVPASAQV